MSLYCRLFFIFNPKSGNSKKIQSFLDQLILIINAQNKNVECIRLNLLENEWVQKIKFANENDLFIACGGDGTVSSVAEKMLGNSNAKLSVLPFGTGNDFSRAIGIFDFMNNCQNLAKVYLGENTHEYSFDVWQIGETYFLNYFSFGLDAKVATHFQEIRGNVPKLIRGPVANRFLYLFSGIRHLFYSNPKDVVLNYDNQKLLIGSSKVVLFSNINSYAGGRKINSQISYNDQAIDVSVYNGVGSYLKLAFGFGSKVKASSKTFQIESLFDLVCQIDGEPKQIQKGLHTIRSVGKIKVVGA